MYNAPRFVQFPRQNPCAKKFPKNFYLQRASGREISQISLMLRIFCTFLENGRKNFYLRWAEIWVNISICAVGSAVWSVWEKNSKISICTQKKIFLSAIPNEPRKLVSTSVSAGCSMIHTHSLLRSFLQE